MTLPVGPMSDDDKNAKPENGNAMTRADEAGGIGPFLAAAGEKTAEPATAPRSFRSRALDYSAHAAMIVGLIGFAWTVSDHVVKHPTAAQIEAPAKAADASATTAAPKAADEMTELRTTNRKLAEDIRTLRANLDNLREAEQQDRTAEQVKILAAGLENVKSGLTSAKKETGSAIAQLSGRLDKIQTPVEHSAAKQDVDTTTTGSIRPDDSSTRAIPTPPAKPAMAKLASLETNHATEEQPAKPQVLAGWVVRDVYDGVAMIEGKHGPLEVVPGVSIPGAGVVKSIDRHGGGWTVTTTKGLLAYAAPQRPYRRNYSRDFYGDRYEY